MRYRNRNGKVQGDVGFLGDVSKGITGAAKKEVPLLIGPFVFLYAYIIGSYAYISRCFLRMRLGNRTFGVFTVAFIIILIWLALIFKTIYPEALSDSFGDISNENILTQFAIYLINFFVTWVYMIVLPIVYLSAPTEFTSTELTAFSTPISILISLIIIMTIGHFIELRKRKKKEELIHSLYRGDSLLFEKLDGKIIFGIKLNMVKIWMLVEPLAVLIFAMIIGLFTTWDDLAFILIVSAICLFLEEYKLYKEDRELTYNTLDQLIDGRYIAGLQKDLQGKLNKQNLDYVNEFRASQDHGSPKLSSQAVVGKKSDAQYRARVL